MLPNLDNLKLYRINVYVFQITTRIQQTKFANLALISVKLAQVRIKVIVWPVIPLNLGLDLQLPRVFVIVILTIMIILMLLVLSA